MFLLILLYFPLLYLLFLLLFVLLLLLLPFFMFVFSSRRKRGLKTSRIARGGLLGIFRKTQTKTNKKGGVRWGGAWKPSPEAIHGSCIFHMPIMLFLLVVHLVFIFFPSSLLSYICLFALSLFLLFIIFLSFFFSCSDYFLLFLVLFIFFVFLFCLFLSSSFFFFFLFFFLFFYFRFCFCFFCFLLLVRIFTISSSDLFRVPVFHIFSRILM